MCLGFFSEKRSAAASSAGAAKIGEAVETEEKAAIENTATQDIPGQNGSAAVSEEAVMTAGNSKRCNALTD